MLVSGRRGSVIGQLVNVSGCVSLTGLELEEADSTLSFTFINQAGAGNTECAVVTVLLPNEHCSLYIEKQLA